jgi:hypothetical protein
MSFTQVKANQALDSVHGLTAMTIATAPVKCRQMTANGSSTTAGTELATSGGYTAGTGAPTITFGAAATGTSATSAAITITNMPATTIVGIETWDSAGTPVRQEFGALSASKTTASGDTLSYAIGAITSALT